jgi:hypothetical protein
MKAAMNYREDREDVRATVTAVAALVLLSFLCTAWMILQFMWGVGRWLMGL